MRGRPGRLIFCCITFVGIAAGEPPARTDRPRMFEPIAHVVPPADTSGWSANLIDCFILAQQRGHDLRPAAPADKRTLIRRVTFDLTGLPPTPEEVADFLADASPDAFARLVAHRAGLPAPRLLYTA